MRRIIWFLVAILGLSGAIQALAQPSPLPIPITGNLGAVEGTGQPYAGVFIQLQNCASPVRIFGFQGVVQQGYQIRASSAGLVSTTIWPNDLIDCNGTTGLNYYSVALMVGGTPSGTTQCYQVTSTQGIWNMNTQLPIPCRYPVPDPRDAQFRNVNITGCLSVDGSPCIVPGSGGGCSTGGIPTLNGSVIGDNPSTNCGLNNRTTDTAVVPAKVQTFGSNNLGGNSGTIVVAVGNNNATSNAAGEVVAIGDTNIPSLTNVSSADIVGIGDGNLTGINSSNQTPVQVVAIGDHNGTNSSINFSTCIGDETCFHINGSDFVQIGDGAGGYAAAGSNNSIAIGNGAGGGHNTGTDVILDQVAIGDGAGAFECGNDFVAIGDASGSNYGCGSASIVAIGEGAARENSTGTNSFVAVVDVIGIGDQGAKSNIGNNVIGIGNYNVGAARFSLENTGNQANNVIGIGEYTLAMNKTGTKNIAIGDYAGCDGFVYPNTVSHCNVSGSQNVWIGYDAAPNTATQLSNTVAIGYQAHNTASNQAVLGNGSMTDTELFGTTHVTGPAGVAGGFQMAIGTYPGLTTGEVGIIGPATGSAYDVLWPGTAPSGSNTILNCSTATPSVCTWVAGGGSSAFSALTSSTNTTATMVVGSGASLAPTGTGTIQATNIASTITNGSGITISGAGTVASPYSIAASGGGSSTVASAEVVAFSATPTFSVAFNVSRIVLTGNITSFTLAAGSDGQDKKLCFAQDATGSRTVAGPANVHGFFTVGSTASKWSCQSFVYDNTDSIWQAVSTGVVNE